MAGSGENQPTACVAVSPEGVVRYWPNIAYEASTAEISAELKGEECACVINFQVSIRLRCQRNCFVIEVCFFYVFFHENNAEITVLSHEK